MSTTSFKATRSGSCPSGDYYKCWYNTITLAVSTYGGRSHHDPHTEARGKHSVPTRPGYGGLAGMFTPTTSCGTRAMGSSTRSSIGTFGTKPSATVYSHARPCGSESWRAWSGRQLVRDELRRSVWAEPDPTRIRVRRSREQIRKTCSRTASPGTPRPGNGCLWARRETAREHPSPLSPDLITWTRPQLFFDAIDMGLRVRKPDPWAYPSLDRSGQRVTQLRHERQDVRTCTSRSSTT